MASRKPPRSGVRAARACDGAPAAAPREAITVGSVGIRRRAPRLKVTLFTGVVLGLLALVGFAGWREASRGVPTASARPSLPAPRPAPSPAEEAYAHSLWPIHNEVKAAALKMTFGGLNYKLHEIDRAGFRDRVESARAVYRRAAARIELLAPPASLVGLHDEYVQAVRLYQEAAGEMVRVLDDGKEDHLATAFPKSQEAGTKLLRVGQVLWPGEYVPN